MYGGEVKEGGAGMTGNHDKKHMPAVSTELCRPMTNHCYSVDGVGSVTVPSSDVIRLQRITCPVSCTPLVSGASLSAADGGCKRGPSDKRQVTSVIFCRGRCAPGLHRAPIAQ